MFEIDCLTKHIAKYSEPTEEQRTKLKVLTELKAVLNNLSANGRAIPLMNELLKVEPARTNRSVPPPYKEVAKPNSTAPNLNRRASDTRVGSTRAAGSVPASAAVTNPPVSSGSPKSPLPSSAGTANKTLAGKAVPGRIETKPTPAGAAPQAVPTARSTQPAGKNAHPVVNHFLNKLCESASQKTAETPRRANAPALPLSAALASHQCSIR